MEQQSLAIYLKDPFADLGVSIRDFLDIFFDNNGNFLYSSTDGKQKRSKLHAFIEKIRTAAGIPASQPSQTEEGSFKLYLPSDDDELFDMGLSAPVQLNSDDEIFEKTDISSVAPISPSQFSDEELLFGSSSTVESYVQQLSAKIEEDSESIANLQVTRDGLRKELNLSDFEDVATKIEKLKKNIESVFLKCKPDQKNLITKLNNLLNYESDFHGNLEKVAEITTVDVKVNALRKQYEEVFIRKEALIHDIKSLYTFRHLKQEYGKICERYNITAKVKKTHGNSSSEFFYHKRKREQGAHKDHSKHQERAQRPQKVMKIPVATLSPEPDLNDGSSYSPS